MNTTELQQNSEEWFAARIGRITASNVGAILGLSPFRTRNDVMRSMVREWNGALSEFVGNVATEYGNFNENLARIDYQMQTGNIVEITGFHSFEDWLGASPDGFVDDGLLEIKCPYSKRNDARPSFNPIKDQWHYHAQIQIQMFVTGREWCHFYQWSTNGNQKETVLYDADYVLEILSELRAFYDEYLIEREAPHNEKHLRSRHADIESEMTAKRVDEYILLKKEIKSQQDLAELLLQQIIADCGESESQIGNHKLTRVSRKNIAYKNALAELLPADVDLTPYESVSTFWTLK